MIKINLNDTYEASFVSSDLKKFTFYSELKDDTQIDLEVVITEHPDPFLADVFNLAFGSIKQDGGIDDGAILKHKNVNKVFSTVLLFAISFLKFHNRKAYSIGIDGSNETRAYLYHRMFRYNNEHLSKAIVSVGVDWYVKLLRNGADIERDVEGFPFFKPRPEPFDLNRVSTDLYRYYMFSLNI